VTIKVLHPESSAKAQRPRASSRRPTIKWLEFSSALESFFTDADPDSAPADVYSRTVYLHCKSHGAVFDVESGLCVAGPCQGRSLLLLETEVRGDELFVKEPPPDYQAVLACA
jgi:hypothetical protein